MTIAEAFNSTKPIVVLLNKSLRQNFRDSLKFCGFDFFRISQHWIFHKFVDNDPMKSYAKEMKIPIAVVTDLTSHIQLRKLTYFSGKNYVRDLLLFSTCLDNNKNKIYSIEKLIYYVNTCKIPKFPISGDYLKQHGYETGKILGKKLKSLEEKWIENNFIIEKKMIDKSLNKNDKN